jgi:hypothetical protein
MVKPWKLDRYNGGADDLDASTARFVHSRSSYR